MVFENHFDHLTGHLCFVPIHSQTKSIGRLKPLVLWICLNMFQARGFWSSITKGWGLGCPRTKMVFSNA